MKATARSARVAFVISFFSGTMIFLSANRSVPPVFFDKKRQRLTLPQSFLFRCVYERDLFADQLQRFAVAARALHTLPLDASLTSEGKVDEKVTLSSTMPSDCARPTLTWAELGSSELLAPGHKLGENGLLFATR